MEPAPSIVPMPLPVTLPLPIHLSVPSYYNNYKECIAYPHFLNYGWEKMYTKFMTNVITVLNIHSDVHRLYLIIQLDISSNNLDSTLTALNKFKLLRSPDAIILSNNLKEMLSDVDPVFLELVGEYFINKPNYLDRYVELVTTNNKSYPKIQEYNDRVKVVNTKNSLTKEFKIQEFLQMCPDPANYFKNVKLNSAKNHFSESVSYLCDK